MTTSNGKLTINEFIAPSGKTWRVLRVARDYVERCDIEPVTNTLRSCVNTKTAAQASFQTLILSIEGYDEDPRELHDVPEVRKFFTDLTRQAPWWVHLPARDFGAMAVWLFCVTKHLSPTTKEGERITVNLDGADMMRRLTESLEATAILYQELGYTEAKFKEAMVELSETLAEAGKLANTGKPVWSGDLTMDPNTGKTVPKPVASGAPGALLNLAVAPTGRPVVMDLVQFLDKKAFTRIGQTLLAQLSLSLAGGAARDVPKMDGFAQEDGSLMVRIETQVGAWEHLRFEKGQWKELGEAEFREMKTTMLDDHENMAEIAQMLGSALSKTADHIKERNQESEDHIEWVSQSIMVFTKNPSSLEYLKIAISKKLAEPNVIENWLQGPDGIFILSNGRDRNSYWSTVASDIGELISNVLPDIAAHAVKELASTVIMPIGMQERPEIERVFRAWQNLGGLIPPGAL